MGIEAEDKFFGQGGGVSTCATCDGHSYRGKTVAVVGGGDSAMEEASYLANLGIDVHSNSPPRRVSFLAHYARTRAQKPAQSRFTNFVKSWICWANRIPSPKPRSFSPTKKCCAPPSWKTRATARREELEVDGVFVAIGHTPNTQIFDKQLKMDEAKYLERDRHMRAIPSANACNHKMHGMDYVPGIFVAGDVSDHMYRQAITAAGMGCMAAIEAERYIAEKVGRMGRFGRQRCGYVARKHRRLALEQQHATSSWRRASRRESERSGENVRFGAKKSAHTATVPALFLFCIQ